MKEVDKQNPRLIEILSLSISLICSKILNRLLLKVLDSLTDPLNWIQNTSKIIANSVIIHSILVVDK